MLRYTVRQCIEEMRKVYSSDIYLYRNGTRIHIYEKNPDCNAISAFKNINGKIVIRRIFCSIESRHDTIGLENLEKFRLFEPKLEYNYFRENDYLIPERDMNLFISLNGGIDHYMTIGQNVYMMMDAGMI